MIELVFLIDIRRVLRGKLLEGRKFFLIIKYFLKVELIILPVVDFPEIVLTLWVGFSVLVLGGARVTVENFAVFSDVLQLCSLVFYLLLLQGVGFAIEHLNDCLLFLNVSGQLSNLILQWVWGDPDFSYGIDFIFKEVIDVFGLFGFLFDKFDLKLLYFFEVLKLFPLLILLALLFLLSLDLFD